MLPALYLIISKVCVGLFSLLIKVFFSSFLFDSNPSNYFYFLFLLRYVDVCIYIGSVFKFHFRKDGEKVCILPKRNSAIQRAMSHNVEYISTHFGGI